MSRPMGTTLGIIRTYYMYRILIDTINYPVLQMLLFCLLQAMSKVQTKKKCCLFTFRKFLQYSTLVASSKYCFLNTFLHYINNILLDEYLATSNSE